MKKDMLWKNKWKKLVQRNYYQCDLSKNQCIWKLRKTLLNNTLFKDTTQYLKIRKYFKLKDWENST